MESPSQSDMGADLESRELLRYSRRADKRKQEAVMESILQSDMEADLESLELLRYARRADIRKQEAVMESILQSDREADLETLKLFRLSIRADERKKKASSESLLQSYTEIHLEALEMLSRSGLDALRDALESIRSDDVSASNGRPQSPASNGRPQSLIRVRRPRVGPLKGSNTISSDVPIRSPLKFCALEAAYRQSKYPSMDTIVKLSGEIFWSNKQVRRWFVERRNQTE